MHESDERSATSLSDYPNGVSNPAIVSDVAGSFAHASFQNAMREQLSVLTGLAFACLLARDGRPAPVILDDALVYSDDDRIERMFDGLHRQSRDQQIIVFSCRQRAFQRPGGNVLQMQNWQP